MIPSQSHNAPLQMGSRIPDHSGPEHSGLLLHPGKSVGRESEVEHQGLEMSPS